jgi:hypothetical protein
MVARAIAAVMVHVGDVSAALRWYERAFQNANRQRSESIGFEYLRETGVCGDAAAGAPPAAG